MTKEEFETARRNSARDYKADALNELRSAKGSRAIANAQHRIQLIDQCEEKWRKSGFWTPETDYRYKTLYSHLPAGAPISPF